MATLTMPTEIMRLKSIRISPDLLPDLLKDGLTRTDSVIPEDAKGVMWGLSDDG